MIAITAARKLVGHIAELDGFELVGSHSPGYEHVGAVLADAILQAGLNYHSVVWPRINRILAVYPEHGTLPAFASLLEELGPYDVLQWKHPEKPQRLITLTQFFLSRHLVTCGDMAKWLNCQENRDDVRRVRGIGPKTVDYMSGLLGLDTVAVDRHVLSFVSGAGIDETNYDFVRDTVSFAADLLGVSRKSLDYSIWIHQMEGRQTFLFQGETQAQFA